VNALLQARSDGTPIVKICGLQRTEDVDSAIEAGADLIGVVFAPSRRKVTHETARALVAAAGGRVPVAGVFVDATAGEISRIAVETGIDIAQLSGSEDPAAYSTIGLPLIKVVHTGRLSSEDPTVEAEAWFGIAEAIIVDSWSVQGGGSGRVADWEVARALIVSADCPVILAGGLTPDIVADAVQHTRPFGVDVSSGVERDGHKDAELIRAFIQAVRSAGSK
jgi:phosphoribosylanthranilate isomerase